MLLPVVSGAVAAGAAHWQLPLVLQNALVADARSPFPMLPWAGYFFAGALTGLLLTKMRRQWLSALALLGVGAAITAVAWVLGPSNVPTTSPVLFAWRVGQVLMICSGAMVLPLAFAKRLAPIGKASLVVYVSHLPVVYGWSTFRGLNGRLGRVLEPWQAIAIGLVLLALGLALATFLGRAKAWLRKAQTERGAQSLSGT